MVACIAIIGPKNNPLHIQPIQEGIANPLKYDFLTFVGLDAVDSILLEQRERKQASRQEQSSTVDSGLDKKFLGLVSITPEYHIYAYVMTNLTKLMVLVSSASKSTNPKFSDDITVLCTQVEKAYKKAVSNPFYVPGSTRALDFVQMLESERFSAEVRELVNKHGAGSMPQTGLASSAV